MDGALRTPRLLLRRWCAADREPFAAINADPDVMAYFPAPLARRESDELIDSIEAGLERHGFGLWAVEVRESGELIGFAGLAAPSFEAHFTPTVEVGRKLAEVVSFTSVGNQRSRAVMERLGMTHDPADDFDHPRIAPGDPLRRHVLYRLAATRVRELGGEE